jgi:hypothetical protein
MGSKESEGTSMTQDQIIQTLHKVIAENMNFTTWTVSTPHLVALVNHAIEAERKRILDVIGNNQCECRCSEVVRGEE